MIKISKKKTLSRIFGLALTALFTLAITSCSGDPTKPAGPGGLRDQPYNPGDGTYK
jgi:hypothetical protein